MNTTKKQQEYADEEQKTKREKSIIRAQILSYAGIIGGVLTFLTHLKDLLELTTIAKTVVAKWNDWTNYIWDTLFSFVHLPIYSDVYRTFTICTMLLCASIGGQMIWRKQERYTGPWLSAKYVRGWHIPIGICILIISAIFMYHFAQSIYEFGEYQSNDGNLYLIIISMCYSIPAIFLFGYKWPLRERIEGVFHTQTLITLMDVGLMYSDKFIYNFAKTPFRIPLEIFVYSITALIVITIVNPKVFNSRMRNIFVLFLIVVMLNALQAPLNNLKNQLLGN